MYVTVGNYHRHPDALKRTEPIGIGHPAGSSVAGGHVAPRPPPYRRTAEATR